MGFPNDGAGYVTESAKPVRDVYSMESVVAELSIQVSRMTDIELALNQRLAPVLRPSHLTDTINKPMPSLKDVTPTSPRAGFVAEQTDLLRESINRIYELLEYVDA
jgi:hypothetical protein